MIFVNRDKLKSVDTNKKKSYTTYDLEQTYQVNDPQTNSTKVYINPNFKNVANSKKDSFEEQYRCQIGGSGSFSHQTTSKTISEKLIETKSELQRVKKQDSTNLKNSILQKTTTSLARNKNKIFLNPQFQGINDKAQNLAVKKVETVKPYNVLHNQKTKLLNSVTSSDKNVNCPKDDLSKKVKAVQQDTIEENKRTILGSNKKKQHCRVYINPQFSSRHLNRSNLILIPTETSLGEATIKLNSQEPSGNKIIINPEICRKEPVGHSSLKTETTPSVCVDSKTIRKRKSSASFLESGNRSDSKKLLFVSKTKLVRNSAKYSINSGKNVINHTKVEHNGSAKSPLKSPNSFYVVSRHKITKQRKRSVSSSSSSMKPSCSAKPSLIKIRSKNGKSLKIVQSNQKSISPLSGSGIQRRLLKVRDIDHQKNRKLIGPPRKNQFSKVNVTSNRSMLISKSRYVYKKKNLAVKKSMSSIILKNKSVNTSTHDASILGSGSVTDKVNVIKTKYRLIRKNCLTKVTKRSSRNLMCDKFAQGSKRWQNHKLTSSKTTFKRHPKHLSIVNIGGVFYQCSRNSLTKNKASVRNVLLKEKSTILQISGKRFKLENNGHTLKCLDKKPGRKRIDIGGITFISSSSGKSLTRTNYHTARSIILQARQKRISHLTRKLRKNNEHCPFFHRFGKCSGKEQGTCTRQHDQKYVTVCKKFVRGVCSDSKCLLSHQISHHNMPTCQHFLAGQCGRDNCPYPHVKVSDDVPICVDFLKGFCLFGAQCAKRHFEICPAFEKGSCSRGKYCPYPHPKSKTVKPVKRNLLKRKPPSKSAEVVSNTNLRYFEDTSMKKEDNKLEDKSNEKKEANTSNGEEIIHPKRPRLGRLPSFIPLSFDKSFSEYSHE